MNLLLANKQVYYSQYSKNKSTFPVKNSRPFFIIMSLNESDINRNIFLYHSLPFTQKK